VQNMGRTSKSGCRILLVPLSNPQKRDKSFQNDKEVITSKSAPLKKWLSRENGVCPFWRKVLLYGKERKSGSKDLTCKEGEIK